jgi:hypothetical protein
MWPVQFQMHHPAAVASRPTDHSRGILQCNHTMLNSCIATARAQYNNATALCLSRPCGHKHFRALSGHWQLSHSDTRSCRGRFPHIPIKHDTEGQKIAQVRWYSVPQQRGGQVPVNSYKLVKGISRRLASTLSSTQWFPFGVRSWVRWRLRKLTKMADEVLNGKQNDDALVWIDCEVSRDSTDITDASCGPYADVR